MRSRDCIALSVVFEDSRGGVPDGKIGRSVSTLLCHFVHKPCAVVVGVLTDLFLAYLPATIKEIASPCSVVLSTSSLSSLFDDSIR